MNVKIFVLSIIFIGFFFPSLFAQLKNNDILLGVSGTYEANNKVGITSLNFEYEKFDINSAILGFGASAKYFQFTNSQNKNSFLSIHTNLNFNKVLGGKIVPFIGLLGGANFELSDNLYGVHIGLRYFTSKNILVSVKNSFNNRSLISPEFGLDYKF